MPITCNTADAIDGGFAYIDSSNTAPTINTTATVNRTTTTVTIKMTTDPTTKFVVGGLVTVALATNTSVNGTWVITSMTSTTIVYTDITSGTITNSNDTGTVTGPNTWLSQQHAKLCLMCTGSSGNGSVAGMGRWLKTPGTDCDAGTSKSFLRSSHYGGGSQYVIGWLCEHRSLPTAVNGILRWLEGIQHNGSTETLTAVAVFLFHRHL